MNKKVYKKPFVAIESFDMDIEIAANDSSMLDVYKDMFFHAYNREPRTEEEFRTWLQTLPGDNDTSHLCYFTVGNIS